MQHRALVVVVALAASPALPCSILVPGIGGGVIPFEGRVVPLNAELRVTGLTTVGGVAVGGFVADDPAVVELAGPDGVVVGDVIVDDVGVVITPQAPLTPGPWTLRIPESTTPARDVAFTVSDDVDDEAPPAPVLSARRETIGSPFADFFGDSCSSAQRDILVVDVDRGADDVALARKVGEPATNAAGFDSDRATLIGATDAPIDVVVRDFAGNESASSTAEAGGCSSGAATPVAAVLALLLRRRRR